MRWLRLAVLAAELERTDRVLDLADQADGDDAPSGLFDVIWCGSRLTGIDPSAWQTFLQATESSLAPGGVIVFTVAGVTPARVCGQLAAAVPNLDLLLYQQGAHVGQDVVACRKRPA